MIKPIHYVCCSVCAKPLAPTDLNEIEEPWCFLPFGEGDDAVHKPVAVFEDETAAAKAALQRGWVVQSESVGGDFCPSCQEDTARWAAQFGSDGVPCTYCSEPAVAGVRRPVCAAHARIGYGDVAVASAEVADHEEPHYPYVPKFEPPEEGEGVSPDEILAEINSLAQFARWNDPPVTEEVFCLPSTDVRELTAEEEAAIEAKLAEHPSFGAPLLVGPLKRHVNTAEHLPDVRSSCCEATVVHWPEKGVYTCDCCKTAVDDDGTNYVAEEFKARFGE